MSIAKIKNTAMDLKPCTVQDITDITIMSANAREKIIRILEVGSLDKIIGHDKAEYCRDMFLNNQIHIKQLINTKILESFTSNNEFIDKFWNAHYIDPHKFTIKLETLIFDDTVAFYTVTEPHACLIIQNTDIAHNYKQLFDTLWFMSMAPNLNFPKNKQGLYFKPIESSINNLNITFYVDAAISEVAYPRTSFHHLEEKILHIISNQYYSNANRLIIFLWSHGDTPMLDIWKLVNNYVDVTSGALANVKVYKDIEEVLNTECASSNTLIIIGHEEKSYRMNIPKNTLDLPSGIIIDEDFFE